LPPLPPGVCEDILDDSPHPAFSPAFITHRKEANHAVDRACQAVGIGSATGDYYREVLSVRDSSALTLAYFEDSGNLRLKKTLSTGQASIDTSNGGFILKDGATVVAYVDTSAGNGGAMKINGSLTTSTTPQTSAGNILEVRDGNGSLVAIVEKDGDMTLKGTKSENYDLLN